MLESIYQELCTLPDPTSEEEESALITACARLLALLQSPDLIHDSHVLSLTAFLGELVEHHVVLMRSNPSGLATAIGLMVANASSHASLRPPIIALPPTYLSQIRADPLFQLEGIVCMASYVRDYFCLGWDEETSPLRSWGFEAAFLLGMRKLHEREHLSWGPNTRQQSILRNFPQGLESLPDDFFYPTPPLALHPKHKEPGVRHRIRGHLMSLQKRNVECDLVLCEILCLPSLS